MVGVGKYTKEENQKFMALWRTSTSAVNIAIELDITVDSVYTRAARLRKLGYDIPTKVGNNEKDSETKHRRCLRCNRMFLSKHAGNRLCGIGRCSG